MRIFIFSSERALKCRKIAINHVLISCLVPELQLFDKKFYTGQVVTSSLGMKMGLIVK